MGLKKNKIVLNTGSVYNTSVRLVLKLLFSDQEPRLIEANIKVITLTIHNVEKLSIGE
jgi:hypothetical protein